MKPFLDRQLSGWHISIGGTWLVGPFASRDDVVTAVTHPNRPPALNDVMVYQWARGQGIVGAIEYYRDGAEAPAP